MADIPCLEWGSECFVAIKKCSSPLWYKDFKMVLFEDVEAYLAVKESTLASKDGEGLL